MLPILSTKASEAQEKKLPLTVENLHRKFHRRVDRHVMDLFQTQLKPFPFEIILFHSHPSCIAICIVFFCIASKSKISYMPSTSSSTLEPFREFSRIRCNTSCEIFPCIDFSDEFLLSLSCSKRFLPSAKAICLK